MEKDKDSLSDIIRKVVKEELQGDFFTTRKLTDIPTDDYMVTPRGYVNAYGTTAQRPNQPSLVQRYFDTSVGKPIWWNGSHWVDATGTPT